MDTIHFHSNFYQTPPPFKPPLKPGTINKHQQAVDQFIRTLRHRIQPEDGLFKLSRIGCNLRHSIWVIKNSNQYSVLRVHHGKLSVSEGGYKKIKKLTNTETSEQYALGVFKKWVPSKYKKEDPDFKNQCSKSKLLLDTSPVPVRKFKLQTNSTGKLKYIESADSVTFSKLYTGDLTKLYRVKIDNITLAGLLFKMIASVNKLHEQGYAHRDIKVDNWVYSLDSKSPKVKLIDFDFRTPLLDRKEESKYIAWRGTLRYLPPFIQGKGEKLLVDRYDQKYIDYYALFTSIVQVIKYVKTTKRKHPRFLTIKNELKDALRKIDSKSSLKDLRGLPLPRDILSQLNSLYSTLYKTKKAKLHNNL